jgi:hypothetical protein
MDKAPASLKAVMTKRSRLSMKGALIHSVIIHRALYCHEESQIIFRTCGESDREVE